MNTPLTFSDAVEQIAAEVRDIVADAALRPDFAPPELFDAVLAYPQAGGKALRPALVTWACEALGGHRAAALRTGTGVELYHTYTLVHDDVIDRDPVRRGRPSVHALMTEVGRTRFGLTEEEAAHYGLSMAILAGDCLQSWAVHLLATLPALGVDAGVALRLVRRLQGITGPAIVEGEARDIQLPFMPVAGVSEADILRVIRTKTSALFAYCGWAGGMLAHGEDDADVRAIETFAEAAGIAFQLQDDVLGLVADAKKLGKPVGNDLREGKRTLIIALGWARANESERALLSGVLGNPAATPNAINDATALLQRLDAIDDVQSIALRCLRDALAHLDRLPASTATELLREFAARMVRRDK